MLILAFSIVDKIVSAIHDDCALHKQSTRIKLGKNIAHKVCYSENWSSICNKFLRM